MATENIVTGKKYRILVDEDNHIWDRVSFWTKASDVENNAGKTLQETVGGIKGITTSTSITSTGYAADATALKTVNDKVTTLNTTVSSLSTQVSKVNVYVDSQGRLHFVDNTGADSVIPFSSTITIPQLSCGTMDADETEAEFKVVANSTTLTIGSLQVGNHNYGSSYVKITGSTSGQLCRYENTGDTAVTNLSYTITKGETITFKFHCKCYSDEGQSGTITNITI